MNLIKDLYSYRAMISSLVKRDLRGRYKRSVLGFLWSFINPLLQLLVYTLVFGIILQNSTPKYYLFLFVALVPWMFFSSCLSEGAGCIVRQNTMISKIYFPREVLPVSFVLYQFVNMLLSFVVVFIVLTVTRYGFNGIALLYFPIVAIIEFILALGFVFFFSAVTVYLRDCEPILAIITMAWQFLSPVMYGVEIIPDQFKTLFLLNPMAPVIVAYRDILYYKKVPEMATLLMALGFGVIFLIIGLFTFTKLKRRFSEVM